MHHLSTQYGAATGMFAAAFMLVLLLFGSGCATTSGVEGDEELRGTVTNVHALIDYLNARGTRVETYGLLTGGRSVHSAAENVYGLQLQTHRGQLVVYEYASADAARRDARQLDFGTLQSLRGTTTMPRRVSRTAPVFQDGSLVVVYLGSDQAVTNSLRRILGDQVLR